VDRLNKLSAYIAEFPTTQFRILVSAAAYIATVVAVLGFDKDPSLEFYGFLCVWAGIDVGQFLSKRATYQPE
jgi:hypothetical protein